MPLLDFKAIQRYSNKAAKNFATACVLHQEINQRLLEHLEFIKFQPQTILDLGARTGFSTQQLRKKFAKSTVIAFDFSRLMLQQFKKPHFWQKDLPKICGSVFDLPFKNHSIDFIFSNLWLQMDDLEQCLLEIQRVLKPDGLFLFSLFGNDTLKELHNSFIDIDHYPHVHPFPDMHDVGDLLLKMGFKNPVMDMEHVVMSYANLNGLFNDLKNTGMANALHNRRRGLLTPRQWQKMISNYESKRENGEFPATFEIIYAHAWGAEQQKSSGEVLIPIDQIKKLDR